MFAPGILSQLSYPYIFHINTTFLSGILKARESSTLPAPKISIQPSLDWNLLSSIERMATAVAEIAAGDPLVGQHVVALSALATSGGSDFLGAVLKSLVVILVTEIGDKTFFIAAVRT